MNTLLQEIEKLDYAVVGSQLKEDALDEICNVLIAANRPNIPEDMVYFLHNFNGISCSNGCIWGINEKHHTIYDIAAENLISKNPKPEMLLLLGENTLTYIAWNKKTQKYVMIDKSTFEELHRFENLAEAISYILKIIR